MTNSMNHQNYDSVLYDTLEELRDFRTKHLTKKLNIDMGFCQKSF